MGDLEKKIKTIKEHIKEYPNFPKPGVLFRDVFSVFLKPEATSTMRDVLVAFAKRVQPPVECIVGVDARGFLLGPLISLELNVPFVPVRKVGKLPGNVVSESYALEYGESTLQIQEGSIQKGQKVLVVDDLLATGGSLRAACKLVQKLGGEVVGCLILVELTELKGEEQVPAKVISVIKY